LVSQWAEIYRQWGLAIVRIQPGQKRPTDRGWTRESHEPGDFYEGCSIGIQAGSLSGDLVCVDIEDHCASG
jgi:hypothetical protein